MTHRTIARQLVSSLAIVGLALTACRPDPGTPSYPVFEPFDNADVLPGPFPFVEGDQRLSLGLFYETGFSEEIAIDNTITNYFIFDGTYDQEPSEDRIEGLESSAIIKNAGLPWWGGGIVYTAEFDLSEWTVMHASFKSTEATYEEGTEVFTEGPAGVGTGLLLSDYGFVADGAWHNLVIPLADFAGTDFTRVTIPAGFRSRAFTTEVPADGVLLVDDVYYTQEEVP